MREAFTSLPNGGAVPGDRVVCRVVAAGDPRPKERPRFWKGRAHTPEATLRAERDLGWRCKEQNPGLDPAASPVAIDVRFHHSKAAATTGYRDMPDLDNLIKLVKDALNGVAYDDDTRVELINARVIRGSNAPRTELVIYTLD